MRNVSPSTIEPNGDGEVWPGEAGSAARAAPDCTRSAAIAARPNIVLIVIVLFAAGSRTALVEAGPVFAR